MPKVKTLSEVVVGDVLLRNNNRQVVTEIVSRTGVILLCITDLISLENDLMFGSTNMQLEVENET